MPSPSSSADSALAALVQEMAHCRSEAELTRLIAQRVRGLLGSDGVTVVLRSGDECHYAEEDGIAPLWRGQRFPLASCASGWVMLHREPAVIPDIADDPRIPFAAYRPTFVKSLALVPVQREEPIAALGVYWARRHLMSPERLALLQAVADAAAPCLARVRAAGADGPVEPDEGSGRSGTANPGLG